jgi:hypothetical protein
MALQIIGSTYIAEVDVDQQLKVALTNNVLKSGFAAMAVEVDPGTFTGTRDILPLDASEDFRLRVGTDSMLFSDPFTGVAINSANWKVPVTGMTVAVSGGYAKLNTGNTLTINQVASMSTYRTFPVFSSFPLYIEFPFQLVAASLGISGQVIEGGLFLENTATPFAPLDGVFIRLNASGEMRLIINFNGSETQSAPINYAGTILPNVDYQALLAIYTTTVEFWVDNVLLAELQRPASTPSTAASVSLPVSFRVFNQTAVASATQVWVGPMTVTQGDMSQTAPWQDVLAGFGAGAYQGQSGMTMGQSANWTNSTEPVAAVLANGAASYTTFGGQWSFAAVAGAVTDFCLFGFTVPASAANGYNKNLIIRGVHIESLVTVAAVATTPTVLQWAIAVGSTNVSLATGPDSALVKSPRRVPLGMQSWIVGAAAGTSTQDIDVKFSSPLFAEPGTFVQIIVRVPIGTATATQIFRGTCYIDAQFA